MTASAVWWTTAPTPARPKLSDLEQVLLYAADKEKPWMRGEQQYAVTGIGCRTESAEGDGCRAEALRQSRRQCGLPRLPVLQDRWRLRRRNAIASAWRRRGGFGERPAGACCHPLQHRHLSQPLRCESGEYVDRQKSWRQNTRSTTSCGICLTVSARSMACRW